jgi:PhzF family phenazine biosynthesis protein
VGTLKWFVELESEEAVRAIKLNFHLLATLPVQGTIVTSRSVDPAYDFVSRYFAPAVGVNEDPATGSAHCALGPYWGAKLGKLELIGFQASERQGIVKVNLKGERVLLCGQAAMVAKLELTAAASR